VSISRRLVLPAFAATVACVAATTTALAGSPSIPTTPKPKNEAAARRIKLERQAIDLINAASRHVQGTVAGCKPKLPPHTSTATHDAPSQAVLDALAPLRRPATPDELEAAKASRIGFGGETYVDYIRHVTTADGHALTIMVNRSVRVLFRLPSKCLDAEHARLLVLLEGKSRKLRSTTLEEFSHVRQGQEANNDVPATPVDGIYLFDSSGGGGGADVASLRERGVFGSIGGNDGSRLNGLVPDGVATVTLEFPKTRSRGPNYKPAVFPSAFTKTVAVHENVLSVEIPRGAPDAFPHRMVWRDATGAVIHAFTDPNF
jgi:hypothetical protein